MIARVQEAPAAEQVLQKHGKSFYWASRLLGERHADRAARLYAFCRFADDVVDERPQSAASDLALLRHRWSYRSGDDAELARFRALADALHLDHDAIDCFLDALERDTGPVRVEDDADLLRYCYGVAGTVGVQMCAALDVSESQALPFAIDLGIGMQLTNISRDVLEDAGRDRIYLPRTRVGRRATPERIASGDPVSRRRAERTIRQLLALADRYYRSADRGMRYLPWRARLGIMTAARVYEAIGPVILRALDEDRYWGARAHVPARAKLRHTARATASLLFHPRYGNYGAHPRHDATLHEALRGLPGADDGTR
ncbi:MAG: phytoene/squalene synthase family protein [Planctomycetota bacterium]